MRWGRFVNSLRSLRRQPVVSTPVIGNAFKLNCIYKPIKQGCILPPSKSQDQIKEQHFPPSFAHANICNSAAVAPLKDDSLESAPTPNISSKAVENTRNVSLYWGLLPGKDNTFARHWNTFTPLEAHSHDEAHISSHKMAEGFMDQLARLSVTALRCPTELLFRSRYYCRAAMLETIASVPGMINGTMLHCRSLKQCEHSGGWVKAFLEEAENERTHLMTFMALQKPSWQERAVIFAVQGIFFNLYILLYLASPRFAHRLVGYLAEESIQSYTELIRDMDCGKVPNEPAPEVAIDYWRLSKDATLRDVILAIRADEAHHRDVNHYAADVYMHGDHLKHAPLPASSH